MRYYDHREHAETPAEEWASVATHALGALLAVTAAVLMVTFAVSRGDIWHVTTLAIFGSTLVAVYVASTLYHALRHPRWRQAMLVCDHACIFLLIAGTYTPFMLVMIGGAWGWSIFSVMWALAVTGVLLKLRFGDRFQLLSVAIYVAMGWMAVICAGQLIAASTPLGLTWLLAGGMAYTTGVVFYLWHHLPFNHAIWHLFVIAGSACHVTAAFHDVLPGT